LEEVIVAFFGLSGWVFRIVSLGSCVKGFASWEEFKAKLKVESSEAIPGTKGFGECIPMDGFYGVVAPSESLTQIRFEKS
jgi:hypothetical protein